MCTDTHSNSETHAPRHLEEDLVVRCLALHAILVSTSTISRVPGAICQVPAILCSLLFVRFVLRFCTRRY